MAEEKESPNESLSDCNNRGGRATGTRNYTHENINTLLTIVNKNLPTTEADWELVANEYNSIYQAEIREGKNLNRKFDILSTQSRILVRDYSFESQWAANIRLCIKEKRNGKTYFTIDPEKCYDVAKQAAICDNATNAAPIDPNNGNTSIAVETIPDKSKKREGTKPSLRNLSRVHLKVKKINAMLKSMMEALEPYESKERSYDSELDSLLRNMWDYINKKIISIYDELGLSPPASNNNSSTSSRHSRKRRRTSGRGDSKEEGNIEGSCNSSDNGDSSDDDEDSDFTSPSSSEADEETEESIVEEETSNNSDKEDD